MIKILFILISVLFWWNQAFAQIIPSARRATWQGNAGVDGGIPNRTVIYQTLNPGDNIQTALNNCPSGQVVYLNAGTYTVTSTITISSNKTLRGAGVDSTIILSNSAVGPIVRIGGGYTEAAGINITSGYTKDSTQIVVADASTISVGDLIRIDELNDATIPVTKAGQGGSCTWCSRANGDRARAQIVKVTGKNSNTLNFTPAFFFNFSSGNIPQIQKLATTTKYAGVEDLTIKNGSSGGTSGRVNLDFYSAENCWAKNIKIDTCGQRGIDIRIDNYRVEIRDSYITGCLNHMDSDNCYGIQLGLSSSCLIENNLFYRTSDGPMLMWGASGNVIGYNYMYDVHRDADLNSWFWPDSWAHGAHTSFNLYEGNIEVEYASDGYWGSNSHNTFFRNRYLGKQQVTPFVPGTVQIGAFISGATNNYLNVVGNILGTSGFNNVYEVKAPPDEVTSIAVYQTGLFSDNKPFDTMLRHYDYDYVTNSVKYCDSTGEPGCQGGNGSHTLPNSLYLVSKPSFFGSCTWPPIDPAGPTVYDIPAKRRYDGNPCVSDTRPAAPVNLRIVP